MNLLHLKNYPIYKQLQLEEALLRADDRNFCIINEGSAPAIVMGISGKPEELIHLDRLAENPIPVIKRFSGGGTVVVDENTLFVSFLFQKDHHNFEAYPEPIMRWSEGIYKTALNHPEFALRENDYVIGNRKFGGNAQYLRKNRWLHHSTLLWDYNPNLMSLLQTPRKAPTYRKKRDHELFLTKLHEHALEKTSFISKVKESLIKQCPCREITLSEITPVLTLPHRRALQMLNIDLGHCETTVATLNSIMNLS